MTRIHWKCPTCATQNQSDVPAGSIEAGETNECDCDACGETFVVWPDGSVELEDPEP